VIFYQKLFDVIQLFKLLQLLIMSVSSDTRQLINETKQRRKVENLTDVEFNIDMKTVKSREVSFKKKYKYTNTKGKKKN
jgi:hypothetical protein